MSAAAAGSMPVLLLGESRRRRLLERVTGLVGDWHAQWASDGIEPPRVALLARGNGPGQGRERVRVAAFAEGEVLLCVCAAPDFVKRLCAGPRERLLPGAVARGHLEEALTEETMRALCVGMVHAALPGVACSVKRCDIVEAERAESAWARRAIGFAIGADSAECGTAAEIAAAPRLVDALLGPRPKHSGEERLVARRQAAEAERVSLTVTLGSASIAWCDLRSLSIGDAIVLDQPLDAACRVSVSGSGAIAEAHLGRAGKALAIQIARIHCAPQRERRGAK